MISKSSLDDLYNRFNRREFVFPDPLAFLYAYPDPMDREIVALIAASLAYGRVTQIMKSVSAVLEKMTPSPRRFLEHTPAGKLGLPYGGFIHRFAAADHLVGLLSGMKDVIFRYGSLHACFVSGMPARAGSVLQALAQFVHCLMEDALSDPGHLLPDPDKGSACKRLHLFLRWMVRKDDVDPGGWNGISPAALIVPLDTHMYRIGQYFGFSNGKQANAKAALEITEGFKSINRKDPVKYDFALTRMGIRAELDLPAELHRLVKGN